MKILEEYNYFYDFQCGFRLNFLINTELMSIIESIQNKLDQNEYAADVFVDLKKAFYTVDHDILIKNLEYYGVRGVTKYWFCSFLKNRKQFPSIDGFVSNTKHISTGVPQGSALAPLLFLIYIDDLNTCVKYSKTYHHADHTNIFYSNKSLEVLVKNISHDLKSLTGWLKGRKLCFNIKKTELIIFRPHTKKLDHSLKFELHGKRLTPAHSIKCLGVLLDEHLKLTKQVTQVKTKLNRAIGILSKL